MRKFGFLAVCLSLVLWQLMRAAEAPIVLRNADGTEKIVPGKPAPADEAGYRNLFNGTDLTGWDGDPRHWSVKDGVIVGQTTSENPLTENTFLIWRDGQVRDFQLRLRFKITANNDDGFANSGIQYRSKDLGNWVVGGYQADMEAGKSYTGILYEERGRGILAQRGQRVTINTL
ncbi:MAG TPA: DUF1080 domain-containing protein, partial [Verrucomicrobiae bacterium]|nr:DUF1080 domain-containing protein [Verrucomicrobiae bacterium]